MHKQRNIMRRGAVRMKRLHRHMRGASTLEWTLVVGTVAIPFYAIIHLALSVLVKYYQMSMDFVGMPFP